MLKSLKLLILLIIFTSMLLMCTSTKIDKPNLDSTISNGSLLTSGKTRTFIYYIPKNLPKNAPLVFVLHKAKSSGSEMRNMINLRYDKLADMKKFIAVYPDGYEGNWNECRKAPRDSAHMLKIDDVAFITALIDYFSEKYTINRSKVYATGMSMGGYMCMRLAYEIPDKLRAIAPTLSQMPAKDNSVFAELSHPLPTLLLHGTEDPISPYNGGDVSIFGLFLKQGKVLSVQDTLKYFLTLHKISIYPKVEYFPDKKNKHNLWIEKKLWKEKGKPTLIQFLVHGGGHTLPGTDPLPSLIFGKTYHNFYIADEIIDFFLKY